MAPRNPGTVVATASARLSRATTRLGVRGAGGAGGGAAPATELRRRSLRASQSNGKLVAVMSPLASSYCCAVAVTVGPTTLVTNEGRKTPVPLSGLKPPFGIETVSGSAS